MGKRHSSPLQDGNFMQEEYATIRANLQKRRQALLEKSSEAQPMPSSQDAAHGDSLDIASSSRDREITFMLKSRELNELRAIEDAIRRIDADDYGICAMCEDPIEIKRLEAVPWARYCLSCQEEMESRTAGRSNLEL
jgi:DnaK suppressor protein